VGVAPPAGIAVTSLWKRLADLFGARSAAERGEAEQLLLEADFGVAATAEILERVAGAADSELAAALEQAVAALLAPPPSAAPAATLARADVSPTVILVCGVNGTGKTTTVAKLARWLQREGRSVLLAAADTFRAGAVDQLKIWAERLGVPCVGGPAAGKGDPAAVAFDAITAARARGIDAVLVDTAGRLHTEDRLVEELKKIARVAAKAHPGSGAPHESLLVLDATTGQNAVQQGKVFAAAIPLTGLIVTKLDGTAKGGSVVALRRDLALPIRFVGTGEGIDDLEAFDARAYARRLVGL
jgi:fused signal recognition particle receptor